MKRIIKFALAIAIFLMLTGCLTTTTTAAGSVGADRSQLMLVSEEMMEQSANESYAQVIEDAKTKGILNTDILTTVRVKNIANRLIAQTGVFREDALSWDWQVNVIDDATVNAWCMPGGKIVVYTGIIESLNLTDAQLAAVMGHEIAHALREHSREQVSREQIKNTGINAISQLAGLGETGTAVLETLAQYAISLPFSRSHETESDHIGTELMARAGYDPNEAVNVWKKMSELGNSSTPEWMSTHPSHESRIKDLEEISKTVYPLYASTTK